MRTRWSTWALLIATWLYWGAPLHATEVIELEVAPGIIATANYQQGDGDKPAILFVHGWLQTREFFTIARLSDALSGSGFTILAPTLSLGINRRAKSLPCESIHSNSINDDISEIDQWATWLSNKTKKPIIIMGHSMGATELIAYLEKYPNAPVNQIVLISIGPIGPGWPENHANYFDRKRAENTVAAGYQGISEYAIAYCEKYPTTAQNLLSFYQWDFKQLISAVSQIEILTHVIIGSEDGLIDTDLIKQLASENVSIDIIEGASHFFDKEFEFELQDVVESHLPE